MRPRRWRQSRLKSNQRRPLSKQRLPLCWCKPLRLLKKAFSVGSKACLAVPKHPPNRRQQLLLAMSRKTTEKVMPNARQRVIAGANAVAVMAAEVAVVATNAVTAQKAAPRVALMDEVRGEVKAEMKADQKAVQKAEAMSAANAAPSSEATSLVLISAVSNATNNAASSVLNSDLKAKSSASSAHRARRVNQAVRALAQSAHAVNEAIEVASNAQRWTPPSKTLPWPTKPQWLRRWAARRWAAKTLAKKHRAVSAVSAQVNAVAAMTAVVNHAMSRVLSNVKTAKTSPTQQLPSQPLAWT